MDHLTFLVILSSDSKPLFFHTYPFLMNHLMFPLGIEMQPLCPIPRTLVVVGNSCSCSSCKKHFSGCLVPSSLFPRTAASCHVDAGGRVGLCHCWHLAGHLHHSDSPSQLGHSSSLESVELESWLFSHACSWDCLHGTAAGTDLMQHRIYQSCSSSLEAFWLLGWCQYVPINTNGNRALASGAQHPPRGALLLDSVMLQDSQEWDWGGNSFCVTQRFYCKGCCCYFMHTVPA